MAAVPEACLIYIPYFCPELWTVPAVVSARASTGAGAQAAAAPLSGERRQQARGLLPSSRCEQSLPILWSSGPSLSHHFNSYWALHSLVDHCTTHLPVEKRVACIPWGQGIGLLCRMSAYLHSNKAVGLCKLYLESLKTESSTRAYSLELIS